MLRQDSALVSDLLAQDVLNKLKISTLPVNPFVVAAHRDITCLENPDLTPDLSGCLMKAGDLFGILYSSRFANEGFKRFTVAHELGHYFLEGHIEALFGKGQKIHKSLSGFISKDKYEREADSFSASLLMPRNLFTAAQSNGDRGLAGIETLSNLCITSLTATAIRFARLSDELMAVICSTGNQIDFAVMSKPLQDVPGLTWISKNSRLTPGTATADFNKNEDNVKRTRRMATTTTLNAWFEGGDSTEFNEEIIGLGQYGRTLTVLWTNSTIAVSDPREGGEDEEESLLPSQRWRERG
ncbi:MAG TPA: ImmA/IrrE family metallo-endopeptidase [bacterium]|jgi:hypothetical protein|nr:ImmA/IrrE family metallo-endopeptidase [bacterium]